MKAHEYHVDPRQAGASEPGGLGTGLDWGTGAFTLALADLLGSDGQIISTARPDPAARP